MKYIDADLLIRKIRGQIRLENLNFAALGGGGQTFCINTLEWVLKQIDSLQQEQSEVDLEKTIEFECIGKKVKMTVQELINYYIDSECVDVADECGF